MAQEQQVFYGHRNLLTQVKLALFPSRASLGTKYESPTVTQFHGKLR